MRADSGWSLRVTGAVLVLAVALTPASCDSISCSGIQYNQLGPMRLRQEPVLVTGADERAHPALGWIGEQVAGGRRDATRFSRRLALDLAAYAREKNQDFGAIPTPVFVVRGVPILLRTVSRCLI